MTIEQVKHLHTGDEVFWTDPDQGLCSKTITIQTIEVRDCRSIVIIGTDGSELECFASELS